MLVPSAFHREWITKYYRKILEKSVAEILGEPRVIRLEITSTATAANGTVAKTPPRGVNGKTTTGAVPTISRRPAVLKPPSLPEALPGADQAQTLTFIDGYDFEHFVGGPHNQLALAAARSLLENPQPDFSGMLVLGGVGLGKTHLLQATCRERKLLHPSENIAYIRGETFLNDFVAAVAKGETAVFRQRYRNLDFVCFDDLQVLRGKSQSQQEFLHTLTAWFDRGARVILAASCPTGGNLDLDPLLLSQLSSAFRVSLQTPERDTRRLIAMSKAQERGESLPEPIADFLADLPITSVRELEGAVTSLIASSRLTGLELNLRTARAVLQEEFLLVRPSCSPDRILRAICEHFEFKPLDLSSRRRPQALSFARQVAMYLLRQRTELSLSEIGALLGGRDHTTVLHGVRKIETEATEDSRVREHLSRIRTLLDS
jgi:chromosomal replication initiator protein